MERGEQAHESGHGVGRGAAEHARVHGVVEGLHPDDDADAAAQGRREGRRADVPVAGVGDDDGVGGEAVAVLLEDRAERGRARLLLALDEDRDADRQVAGVGAERGDVRHDAGLVVGGTAAVEATVALLGLERRAVPVGVVAGRLHVVVRVERHGRRALGAVEVADDGRAAALDDDLDVEALAAQQLGHGLGAAGHLALVEGRGRDARDAHELLEVGPDLRHEVGHAVADLLDLVGGEGVVSHVPDPTDARRRGAEAVVRTAGVPTAGSGVPVW